MLPGTNSPGVSVSNLFLFQSYFDSTLMEKALLIQSPNSPIVGSTLQKVGVPGYCVGLHPSSQTPVAFLPDVGGAGAGQQAVILRPGQIYRPHGMIDGKPGHFASFQWGLPFGWLGGGLALLYVFPSPDADVAWPGNIEVIFHRQRMQIYAGAAAPNDAPYNWPMRFPWPHALRDAAAIPQPGAAQIAINPTRILMSLRLGVLGAANDVRLLFQSTNDFDLDATGAPVATAGRFQDMTWGTYAASTVLGNLATNYPMQEITGPAARVAADDGGMVMVDLTGGLAEQFVDVVRLGTIG